MAYKILTHSIIFTSATALMLLGVLVCIFPHTIPSLSWVVNYAVHIMLIYLGLGICMLFLRQPRLTFVFFTGCAFLCIFLKYSLNSNGLPRIPNSPAVIQPHLPEVQKEEPVPFKVAHFNLTNIDSFPQLTQALRATNADLVTIHEVTPNWASLLKDSLSGQFNHHHTMVDIGIFGMAIYAKYPLQDIDTFHFKEIPNLHGCIQKNGEQLCFISVQTEPALNDFSLKRLQSHLGVIGQKVVSSDSPTVVLGDFNSVSWSVEVQSFLEESGLMESRTGFMPYPFVSTTSMFEVPLDHIFYSESLQCLQFENIADSEAPHLGISGIYTQKRTTYHAKKTAR